MTTDCYIYARVSTSKQVTDGHGLDSQLTRCLNYAKYNNYNVVKTYEEKGVSGRTLYRPELEKLFLDLKQNKNNKIVLVDSLSRFTRDFASSAILYGKLTKLKTKIIPADMKIPDGITGEFFRNIFGFVLIYVTNRNKFCIFYIIVTKPFFSKIMI